METEITTNGPSAVMTRAEVRDWLRVNGFKGQRLPKRAGILLALEGQTGRWLIWMAGDGAFYLAPRAPRCKWFALCERDATTTTTHPILGDVPTCAECHRLATWDES